MPLFFSMHDLSHEHFNQKLCFPLGIIQIARITVERRLIPKCMKWGLLFCCRINSFWGSLSVPFAPSCFSDCAITKCLCFSALLHNQQGCPKTPWALAPFWPRHYNKEKNRFEIILDAVLERESGPPQPTQMLSWVEVIKRIHFCSPSDLAPLCTGQMAIGSSALHIQLII